MFKSFIVTEEIVRSITILNVADEAEARKVANETEQEKWSTDFVRSLSVVEEQPN